MAPNFLTSTGNASSVKHFQIRVDEPNLIIRGDGEEATSAQLKGTLVLCLSEPLKVQSIHMRLTGELRLGFPNSNGPRAGHGSVKQEQEIYRKSWAFLTTGKGRSEILPAGNYEYPFETIIPGNLAESIEGLSDSWIIYRMKATIDRGILATNVYARRHLRVVRAFDPSALELVHAMSLENVWPDKIDYCLSIPTKAVIFGTNVNVDFNLVPLLKGLKIGTITTELVETVEMTTEYIEQTPKNHVRKRVVSRDIWDLPDGTEAEDLDGREGYKFVRPLPIPKSLRHCVQTVESKGIKVRHRLKFVIQLINPDEHVSELRATLPVHIFISPSLPLDENNTLVDPSPQSIQSTEDMIRSAPPLYGDHHFDQLYSDIDPSVYMTPTAASGSATPYYSQSQSGSIENLASLASMDNVASSNFSPNTLDNRLSNLQIPGSSRWARDQASGCHPPTNYSHENSEEDPFPHGGSLPRTNSFSASTGAMTGQSYSNPVSRRASEEDEAIASGAQTPVPVHIERLRVDELSKVPSYGTALKTPVRTPNKDNLPNYMAVINRPLTPPPPPAQYLEVSPITGASPASTSTAISETRTLVPQVQPEQFEIRRQRMQSRGQN